MFSTQANVLNTPAGHVMPRPEKKQNIGTARQANAPLRCNPRR